MEELDEELYSELVLIPDCEGLYLCEWHYRGDLGNDTYLNWFDGRHWHWGVGVSSRTSPYDKDVIDFNKFNNWILLSFERKPE